MGSDPGKGVGDAESETMNLKSNITDYGPWRSFCYELFEDGDSIRGTVDSPFGIVRAHASLRIEELYVRFIWNGRTYARWFRTLPNLNTREIVCRARRFAKEIAEANP